MKESFVFYVSFWEALKNLPDEERLAAYDAICQYALTGSEKGISGITAAVLSLVKPQIDANARRYEKQRENGKKGGRPKATETQRKPNRNQKKPNDNPTETLNVNVNVNENVNVKEKVKKEKHGTMQNVLLTEAEYGKLVEEYGQGKTDKAVEYLSKYIVEKDYKTKSHYLTIRRWVMDAVSKPTSRSGTNKFVEFSGKQNYDMDELEKMLEG